MDIIQELWVILDVLGHHNLQLMAGLVKVFLGKYFQGSMRWLLAQQLKIAFNLFKLLNP
jgi:hypothetical protein